MPDAAICLTIDKQKAIQLHKEGKAEQLHGLVNSKVIKAAVYGANDGIITAFAVVAGVAGAGLSPSIVLILGIANILADGIAMGVGDYLGEQSEQRFKKYQFEVEKWEVKNIPVEEKKELVQYFEKRNFASNDIQKMIEIIQKYPDFWAELGFSEEMGSNPEFESRLWPTGVATFFAFVFAGCLPLFPYALHFLGFPIPLKNEFVLSVISTGVTLFIIGSLRTLVTKGRWWKNGFEMLAIGAIAATCAFVVGTFIKNILP